MKKETLVDDLDKITEVDVREHTVALDGNVYDIDLADTHWAKLNDAIAVFLAAARPRTTAPVVTTAKSHKKKITRVDPEQLKREREWIWAHQDGILKPIMNGRKLSSHGRIPEDLRAAYQRLAGNPHPADEGGAGLFSEAAAAR